MSQSNPAHPDAVAESDEEIIDVPDDSASQCARNKRAPGRPASDSWKIFKRISNPSPGNSKRGVCKDCGQKVTAKPEELRKHASNCRKSSKESRLASQVQQTKAGGGGGDSSQLSIDSYCDSREVTAEHAKWLADSKLAQHMTLALDGWSNARMESIYSFNIIFPDRRVILLKANELSSLTHSAENIAELVVNITEEYGPRGSLPW
ncbi:TPA: hypothetical protein ACH3X1_016100 [Trebouxia sp. C0004]